MNCERRLLSVVGRTTSRQEPCEGQSKPQQTSPLQQYGSCKSCWNVASKMTTRSKSSCWCHSQVAGPGWVRGARTLRKAKAVIARYSALQYSCLGVWGQLGGALVPVDLPVRQNDLKTEAQLVCCSQRLQASHDLDGGCTQIFVLRGKCRIV